MSPCREQQGLAKVGDVRGMFNTERREAKEKGLTHLHITHLHTLLSFISHATEYTCSKSHNMPNQDRTFWNIPDLSRVSSA